MNAADRANPQGVYAITDSQLLTSDPALLNACECALDAGIVRLQYRDKSADHATRQRRAEALAALCQRFDVALIINDDLELASDLHQRWGDLVGVHLGQQDTSIAAARARLGSSAIIGATCHGSLEFAARAAEAGASYLAFGRLFASRTKPQAPLTAPSVIRQAGAFGLPRVAIGGIDATNVAAAREAGAEMVAVVHAVFGAKDIGRAVRELNARLQAV